MEAIGQLGVFIGLLVIGYTFGQRRETRHLRLLDQREAMLTGLMALPIEKIPGLDPLTPPQLVTGTVCVSIDYFKRFASAMRGLVGGQLSSYETVIDRARREAVLRMKEEAHSMGYDIIVAVRVETSQIANSNSDGKGTAGMEVVAYGTAMRLRPDVR